MTTAKDYHLVYVMNKPSKGDGDLQGAQAHAAEEGAGALLTPGEGARSSMAGGSDLDLLHMVVPKPPTAVEDGLPGGPGYFFTRKTLRGLTDASGGRVRRFCAESSVRLPDGSRLTSTNAIQAGEMHYNEGGASPYHLHKGTPANPEGAAHCYMTFKGRGKVEVGETRKRSSRARSCIFRPVSRTACARTAARSTISRFRRGEASRRRS